MAGRPRFEPTPEQRKLALRLARVAVSDREIARSLRCDVKTLRRSDLGGLVHDVRLKLKVKLLSHLVRETLPDRGDTYAGFGDVGPLLKRLDNAGAGGDDGPDDAEIDAKEDGNDTKQSA